MAGAEDEENWFDEPGEIDEEAERQAAEEALEDAGRRSPHRRDSSMGRAELLDYLAFRGVHLSKSEERAPLAELRRVALDRLA